MGEIQISDVPNVEIGRRAIVVSPPEPPAEYLMADPKNSVYIGRTEVFNVPFHWTYQRLINPHVAITGVTGSGKSVHYSTNVLIRQNGKIKQVKIGEFIDNLIIKYGGVKIDDCEGIENPDLEVYTFDSNLKGVWSKVLFAGRKEAPEHSYKFRTASGREIETTGDHNIVVLKNGMLSFIKGSEVSLNDYIPIPRIIRNENISSTDHLDLFEILAENKKLYVPVNQLYRWLDKKSINMYKTDKKLIDKKLIPLNVFVSLLTSNESKINQSQIFSEKINHILVCSSNGNGKSLMPSKLFLSKEFARLLGYYVSEGMLYNGSVIISNTDKSILNDISSILNNLGNIKFKEIKKGNKAVGIRIYSLWLYSLFDSLIGSGSENKKVPEFLYSSPDWFVAEYLRAYYEGDGCVERNAISCSSKSKQLINDHSYLLLRFGIIGRIKAKSVRIKAKQHGTNIERSCIYYNLIISGEGIKRFIQIGFVSELKQNKLHALLKRVVHSNTNVDVIPEIGSITKHIYSILRFRRTQTSYAISQTTRRPSRETLNRIIKDIEERKDEIEGCKKDIEALKKLPAKDSLIAYVINTGKENQMYKRFDETWRRAKNNLVKTNYKTMTKIVELAGHADYIDNNVLSEDGLKSSFIKLFDLMNLSMQRYNQSLYEFCTGRHSTIAYQTLFEAAQYLIAEYDKLYQKMKSAEHEIEFLKLLSSSDLFWDPIISIEKVKSSDPYVYDLCVDNEVFLAGFGGLFVHNSYFIKTFLLRASLVWNANALIIDWAGEYKAWVKQVGGLVIALAKGAYLNLLDLAGMKPSDRVKQVIRSLEILTDIGQYPEQRRLIEQAIEEAYVRAGFKLSERNQRDALGNPLKPPTLKDVQKILQEKLETGTYEFPAELENAIYKLKRFTLEGDDYFAEQSTVDLDKLLSSGLVALDLSGLPDETFRALGALTILQFIKEKMRMEGWSPEKGIKLFCLHGDEEVTLADGRNIKIRELIENKMIGTKVQCFNNQLKIEEDEIVAVQKLPAPEKLYKITLSTGDVVRVTPDHKFPVLKDGRIEWIEARDVGKDDFIMCPRKLLSSSERIKCRDLLDDYQINNKTGKLRGKKGIRWIKMPEYLNEEICYLHGLVLSDGCIDRYGVRFVSTDKALREKFKQLMEKNFEVKVTSNDMDVIASNVLLVSLFKKLSKNLLRLPRDLIIAWLRGYSDGDGSISMKHKGKCVSPYITLCPANIEEANLVRDMLLRAGITSYININKRRKTKVPNGKYVFSKPLPVVVISGKEDVEKYIEVVGFREKNKAQRMKKVMTVLPKLSSYAKRDLIPTGNLLTEIRNDLGVSSKGFRDTIGIAVDNYEYGVYTPSRSMLQNVINEIEEMYEGSDRSIALNNLRMLVEADVMPIKIIEKKEIIPDEKFVYDITTKNHHNFFVNRIGSSNCVLDEAWKISKDENSDAVMIVREGRKYQFALIVASQTPTDINEVIFSNVGTVFMLRLKFEKYLDYLQNTLRFSNHIRQKILSFGVGQAAVSMAYEATVPFSETFILKRIDGEEPIIDYFVDIYSILTEAQRRDETMPKSYSRERTAFKKRLREMGLSDERVEEIATMIEKKSRHMDAVDLVIELERRGVVRKAITSFFRELGIDDSTIINIFTRADQKRTGLTDKEISQVVLE